MEKQQQYEHYRGLFTGMMTDRHPDTGLSVLLCKGMKAWLMYKPHNPPPQPPSTAKGSSSRLQGKDELVALLATMIGGV